MRDAIYAVAAATGLAGLGFHTYNILKRPGGLLLAQSVLRRTDRRADGAALAGFLGAAPSRYADTPQRQRPTLFGLPAGPLARRRERCRVSPEPSAEAGLLHFRGAFQNPLWCCR